MPTLNEAWEIYCGLKSNINLNDKRHANIDVSRWEMHIKNFFGDLCLEEIKAFHIIKFRIYLENQGYMPQTVKHYLGLVRRILKKAVQLELYSGPVPYFEMPKFDNTRYRFLTREEATRLMQAIAKRSEKWHDISLFALATGLRAGEIWRIRKETINLNDKQIYVMDGKSHRVKVTLLSDTALSIVNKHLSRHNVSGYLFESRNGKKIVEVSKSYTRAVEESGLNIGVSDPRQKVV
ncbi:MAG: tyrosine-type recombinase/integrase, partial [Desulfovibrionaceae bacterium]|nr:tyrosine-type recombinase/integrase [Desulfovibrionaceae bacterium]